MTRRRWIVAGVVAGLLGLGAGGTAFAAPAVAAMSCPQCYGLTGLGDGVYADREDASHLAMVAAAKRRIADFYGERTSDARVLICTTAECYRRIGGGGEKGRAFGRWALMLSPAGADETIATHELAHIEMHKRLGWSYDRVPRWFDEGLAVVISDDARYLRPASEPDRCRVPYEEAAPVAGMDWAAVTKGGSDRGYLLAACVVSRWLTANDVRTAIEDLRNGGTVTP